MTQDQKLEIVYKKLLSQRAFTKEGTQFFEEPFSTFSQVIPSYVYVNSDYIPQTAPNETISVSGFPTLTYVEREKCIPIDSTGKKFKCGIGKIIPISYGTGYGVELRTQSGSIINEDEFSYLVDWESGEVTFDETPFDVGFKNPPLATYHFYSGKTLDNISTFTVTGPRGNIGPTGDTGPIDESVLIYRGQTDFTGSPSVVYNPNDVITFITNGNSYICLSETDESPIVSPSSWENISPSGISGQMPENVFYVNHPNSIPTSSLTNGAPNYYTSIESAIEACPDETPTTIIVNQLNNQTPVASGDILIQNKILNIVFKKWSNFSSREISTLGFRLTIIDSEVTIENAQIGGLLIVNPPNGYNEIDIQSQLSETRVKFLGCRINSKLISCSRNADYNTVLEFERCSLNSQKLISNSDVTIKDTTFSGSLSFDYTGESVRGKKHRLSFINSFGFQRATTGSVRNIESYDVSLVLDQYDTANAAIKLENTVFPAFGVATVPPSLNNVTIDCNNSVFYSMGMNVESANKGGTITLVGSNNTFGVVSIFNNFQSSYFLIDDPLNGINEDFYFSLNAQGGTQTPVVVWDPGSIQFTDAYMSYKEMIMYGFEGYMLSL